MSNRVASDRKTEDLRHCSGQIGHGELAFPRLTEPAFLGNLLDVACAFTQRVSVAERYPDPENNDDHGNEEKNEQRDQRLVSCLSCRSGSSRGLRGFRSFRGISHLSSVEGMPRGASCSARERELAFKFNTRKNR